MSLRNHIYFPNAQKPGVCRICGEKKAKCQSYGTEDPTWMKPASEPGQDDRARIVAEIRQAVEKRMIAHIDSKDEFVSCITRYQLGMVLDMAEKGYLDPAPPPGIAPKHFPSTKPFADLGGMKWPPD